MHTEFIAGMPHLALGGLSENWLLKECGHHHWQLLAERYGRRVPDFKEGEDSAYAAFTAIRVTDLAPAAIGENAAFSLDSQLCAAGRARHFSRHQLKTSGEPCGTIEMLSAFVRRDRPASNHRVHRAQPGGVEDEFGSGSLALAAARLLEANREFRIGDWQRDGFRPASRRILGEYSFLPCPSTDFNGAGFLYCASFQSMVERAEWSWFRATTPVRTLRREIHFFGNLDVGDAVLIRLCGMRRNEQSVEHWSELARVSDGKTIAQVVTCKSWVESSRDAADFRGRGKPVIFATQSVPLAF
jgi:probable biosynthetic protein (TIGR04099 family)